MSQESEVVEQQFPNPDSSPPRGMDEPRGHDENNDEFEFDVDELKTQLGIDKILEAISSLSDQVTKRKASEPEGLSKRAKPDAQTSISSTAVFDPSLPVIDEVAAAGDGDNEYILPSIFEEADSFGPAVSDMLAGRVNSACTTKPVEGKMKELEGKYQAPQNCQLLVVPKVNLELWFDLQKSVRVRDLSLQEIQKYIVKATQPLVIALDKIISAKNKKESIDPSILLPELADTLSFLGHASYQSSLKRREALKPHINQHYQSVCSKNTPITKWLFGDELAKNIKDIGEVNKISKKVAPQASQTYKGQNKSSGQHSASFSHGKRASFLGYRRNFSSGRRGFPLGRSSTNTSSYNANKTQKDKT